MAAGFTLFLIKKCRSLETFPPMYVLVCIKIKNTAHERINTWNCVYTRVYRRVRVYFASQTLYALYTDTTPCDKCLCRISLKPAARNMLLNWGGGGNRRILSTK